ncbi:Cell wall protein RBR3 [Candida viswanathii]|uniref:Cell wall protein RBR3 n=1 Tax=Candida viswanathii TaxID=5486 RepID=A0A367Y3U5_9ASCO|nr:Cell wall protein RBR3 [Candida viswanathii]
MVVLPLLFLAAFVAAATKNDISITRDTRTHDAADLKFDDVFIAKNNYWSILNNRDFYFAGKFQNEGSMFITASSKDRALNVNGHHVHAELVNNGLMVLNSIEAASHASSYKLAGSNFENNGKMYFGASLAHISSYTNLVAKSWSNNGVLEVYRDNTREHRGSVVLGSHEGITNNGHICLYNHDYQQANTILGTGCITIGANSYVELKTHYTSSGQTIVFEGSSGTLEVLGSADARIKVAGFGNGNIIRSGHTLHASSPNEAYQYNSYTGILTLRHHKLVKEFEIGLGYDSRLFEQVSHYGVAYRGPVPEGATSSDKCLQGCGLVFPTDPGSMTQTPTSLPNTNTESKVSTIEVLDITTLQPTLTTDEVTTESVGVETETISRTVSDNETTTNVAPGPTEIDEVEKSTPCSESYHTFSSSFPEFVDEIKDNESHNGGGSSADTSAAGEETSSKKAAGEQSTDEYFFTEAAQSTGVVQPSAGQYVSEVTESSQAAQSGAEVTQTDEDKSNAEATPLPEEQSSAESTRSAEEQYTAETHSTPEQFSTEVLYTSQELSGAEATKAIQEETSTEATTETTDVAGEKPSKGPVEEVTGTAEKVTGEAEEITSATEEPVAEVTAEQFSSASEEDLSAETTAGLSFEIAGVESSSEEVVASTSASSSYTLVTPSDIVICSESTDAEPIYSTTIAGSAISSTDATFIDITTSSNIESSQTTTESKITFSSEYIQRIESYESDIYANTQELSEGEATFVTTEASFVSILEESKETNYVEASTCTNQSSASTTDIAETSEARESQSTETTSSEEERRGMPITFDIELEPTTVKPTTTESIASTEFFPTGVAGVSTEVTQATKNSSSFSSSAIPSEGSAIQSSSMEPASVESTSIYGATTDSTSVESSTADSVSIAGTTSVESAAAETSTMESSATTVANSITTVGSITSSTDAHPSSLVAPSPIISSRIPIVVNSTSTILSQGNGEATASASKESSSSIVSETTQGNDAGTTTELNTAATDVHEDAATSAPTSNGASEAVHTSSSNSSDVNEIVDSLPAINIGVNEATTLATSTTISTFTTVIVSASSNARASSSVTVSVTNQASPSASGSPASNPAGESSNDSASTIPQAVVVPDVLVGGASSLAFSAFLAVFASFTLML